MCSKDLNMKGEENFTLFFITIFCLIFNLKRRKLKRQLLKRRGSERRDENLETEVWYHYMIATVNEFYAQCYDVSMDKGVQEDISYRQEGIFPEVFSHCHGKQS